MAARKAGLQLHGVAIAKCGIITRIHLQWLAHRIVFRLKAFAYHQLIAPELKGYGIARNANG